MFGKKAKLAEQQATEKQVAQQTAQVQADQMELYCESELLDDADENENVPYASLRTKNGDKDIRIFYESELIDDEDDELVDEDDEYDDDEYEEEEAAPAPSEVRRPAPAYYEDDEEEEDEEVEIELVVDTDELKRAKESGVDIGEAIRRSIEGGAMEDDDEDELVEDEAETEEEYEEEPAQVEEPQAAVEEEPQEEPEEEVFTEEEQQPVQQVAEPVQVAEPAQEAEEPEVKYVVEGPVEDDDIVKPAKLVKLPNLVDYMISLNMSKRMKMNVCMLLLTAYHKYKHIPREKAIVITCMKKMLNALLQG